MVMRCINTVSLADVVNKNSDQHCIAINNAYIHAVV